MLNLARRASGIPRSAIREIMALAAERQEVIHLELVEPDFPTPAHITDGALEAAKAGWTKYTVNAGIPTLLERIAERVTSEGRHTGRARAGRGLSRGGHSWTTRSPGSSPTGTLNG